MGFYVNPPDDNKENWLNENGLLLDEPAFFSVKKRTVCLVDNGFFTAAAVCINLREFEEFSAPGDSRPKKWFVVPVEKLRPVTPANTPYCEDPPY